MSENIAAFLDSLQSADGIPDLQNAMSEKLKSLGFENFTYVGFNELGVGNEFDLQTDFPVEWIEHYTNNRYAHIDPMFILARRSTNLLDWAQIEEDPNLSRLQKLCISEGRDFGLKNGITVPIHGPNGRFALFSATTDLSDEEFSNAWTRHRYDMQLIAQYYDSTFLKVAKKHKEEHMAQLSAREAECLVWIARGKTASEVSDILALSYDTVVYYLRQCSKKLGTYNRIQTVAKAILTGAIKP